MRYIIKHVCVIPWWQKKLLEGATAKKIQLRDTKGGHVLVSSVDCTLVPGLIPTFNGLACWFGARWFGFLLLMEEIRRITTWDV